jgi:membrane protein implicated in regulation of membrane protease activity
LALAAGIVELLSPTFGFVFVSLAALPAALLAWLGVPLPFQLLAFALTLLLSLVFLRPLIAGRLKAQGVPTRTQALIGRVGLLTAACEAPSGLGRVEVEGQDWAARCCTGLPAGVRVRITGAEGIVLSVEPVEQDVPQNQ